MNTLLCKTELEARVLVKKIINRLALPISQEIILDTIGV